MTQLLAWEYEGNPEWGFDYGGYLFTACYPESQNDTRYKSKVTNLRKVKVVDETEQKTYLTTEQFIKVFKSLSDEKSRELSKAWNAANFAARNAARNAADFATWNVARDADLAILAKDAITKEHFNILMQPWISCDLSPFVEDWEAVLNPKVEEPKNFGAAVEAEILNHKPRMKWVHRGDGTWYSEDGWSAKWRDFPNPSIISEGVGND